MVPVLRLICWYLSFLFQCVRQQIRADTHTHTHTHKPSTITLTAYARRGLKTTCHPQYAHNNITLYLYNYIACARTEQYSLLTTQFNNGDGI